LTSEVWKAIPGFEGEYEASDRGRIRSLDRYASRTSMCGVPYVVFVKGRILVQTKYPSGHVYVGLVREKVRVHALIAETFIGPRPERMEVRHLNGQPDDNRLCNLEYGTPSRNVQDRKWHRLPDNYKLTGEQARLLKLMLRDGVQQKLIAARFGVSATTVSCIKTGKIHRDVII